MQRYALNAEARADELLDLMSEEQTDILREWLRVNLDRDLLMFIVTLSPKIEKIIAQTPAKDRAWVQKTARPTFVREWLAARHWAIVSARALRIAAELQDVPGLGYRQAVQHAAPVADKWMDQPEIEDLLTARLLYG